MLFLAHFLLCIGADELFDNHEPTTHTNYQPSIEDLREDLARAKHVEAVAETLDWHRTSSLVDVVTKKLVKHVAPLAREELGGFLVLALLDDGLVEEVNLLVAYLQLGLNLGQISFSCLDELVELVNMLAEDIFFVLQVPNIVLISAAALPQVVDFFIKIE